MRTLTEFSGVVARRAQEVRAQKTGEGLEGDALVEAIGVEVGVTGDRLTRLLEIVEAAADKLGNVRLVRVFQPGEGEAAPRGAISIGEFHYVLDRMAAPAREERGRRGPGGPGGGREARGRGGPGGGPGGGRGGPGGGPGGGGGRPGGGLGGLGGGRRSERGDDRGERVNPREVPVAGAGWMLSRAPRDPDEDRDKRGRGGPRRDGRGPRRDRPGGGPGGDRPGGRGPRRSGPPAPQARPGAGPKTEVSVADLAAGGAGDPAKRRRRRGGRGRGPRPPGAPGAPGAAAPQEAAPDAAAQAPEAPPPPAPPAPEPTPEPAQGSEET